MKKILILFLAAAAIGLQSCSPNPEKIMAKAYEKCQSVENGYYEMQHYMKYMSGNDTTKQSYKCHFKKLPGDSIFSSAFHYVMESPGGLQRGYLYTGNTFVRYNYADSSGTIMQKEKWADKINNIKHNYTFYSPLVNRLSYPLKSASDTTENKHTYTFLGEQKVNDYDCYHILRLTDTAGTSYPGTTPIRIASQFWINKADYVPVQYTLEFELIEMGVDTVNQYEINTLTTYHLNNVKDSLLFNLSSVPAYFKLSDYVPHKAPELLAVGSTAPGWSLLSLKNQQVTLNDLRGSLVLIDFFYKSCHPCMLALPTLQRLHEKYHDRGLRIVGIDPYDSKEEDELDDFLTKRGITYTVLLSDKNVPEQYHVSGYPTLYLIGYEGKVIFRQVGYGETTEENLEKIILKNL